MTLWCLVACLYLCVSVQALGLKGGRGRSIPHSCSSDVCVCQEEDEGWFLPYPCNCHWYYECAKSNSVWNATVFDCGTMVFDPHQEACIWPELAPASLCDLPDDCQDCPLPCQTVVAGQCSPECCTDPDCPSGQLCSEGVCVEGECRTGADCGGYNTVCHEPWQQGEDNCQYCDNMETGADVGTCQPGCEDSRHDMCPTDNICDGKHYCVSGGSTLLKKIVLTTSDCSGCSNSASSEGGVRILVNTFNQECLTDNLDHQNQMDYTTGTTAIFESVTDLEEMGQCNNAEVNGGPKTADITWTGVGTWTPSRIVLEVSGEYQYTCQLAGGGLTSLGQGQTVQLQCSDQ